MKYNFDQVIDRRASDSVKWNAYAPDVIPMWIADMDFPSPEPVIRALVARAQHGVFGYPDSIYDDTSHQLSEFRQMIMERLARHYQWQITPEEIVFAPSVVVGFHLACLALAHSHEAVLVQTPVYPPILAAAHETGIQGQKMMLTRNTDGSYSVDWDAFEASITPETRLFILCNPHNPVGKVFQPEELAHLAEICLRHNVTIVADEVHCDLVYPESRHTPIATLDNEVAQNTITLMSPSKTYNLAGLQVSFAIIPNRELRKRYMFAGRSLIPWVNIFGLLAGQVAYQEGEEWLQEVLLYLKANRDYLLDFARQHLPGVHLGYPQGTYLAWLDCRQANLPIKPYQFFLEKAGVALNDGEKFGRGGEGFVRLNFACPRPLLQQGLERMSEALQNNLSNRADD